MDQAAARDASFSSTADTCGRCGCNLTHRASFAFKGRARSQDGKTIPAVEIAKCFSCALRHTPMLRRSVMAALFVGTILTLLNQGDLLLSGSWNNVLYWKIPLTYCVPFLVATYGAMINNRR